VKGGGVPRGKEGVTFYAEKKNSFCRKGKASARKEKAKKTSKGSGENGNAGNGKEI